MGTTDTLLENARAYASAFTAGGLTAPPALRVAVVTCMDARIDPQALLGLAPGDAHVIRNAGGAVTDDVIRSLAISQRLLGTEEIVLIHHTRCGMATFTDEEFLQRMEDEVGTRPPWAVETFPDPEAGVLRSMRRIREDPFILHAAGVRGFVYDVEDARLHEVLAPR